MELVLYCHKTDKDQWKIIEDADWSSWIYSHYFFYEEAPQKQTLEEEHCV